MEIPPSSEKEFWEPKALELLSLLEEHGPLSLREIKRRMIRKGYKVGVIINTLSYLDISGRSTYSRELKKYLAINPRDGGIG